MESRRKITGVCAAVIGLLICFPAAAAEPAKTRSQKAMERVWGGMVGDGAEWRTPNPDFADAKSTPKEFAIRWCWDSHRQYAIGELLGVFDSPQGEKTVLYWNLYAYHNPVTDEVTGMQIGWDGAMASGPMHRENDGRIILHQILYNADGSLKALRHEDIMEPSGRQYRSNVYERGDGGEWTLKRKWTWTRVKPAGGAKRDVPH